MLAIVKSATADAVTVNSFTLVAVPPNVATAIGPVVASAGTVAVMFVAEFIVKDALCPLNVTLVANARFIPEIVTLLPASPLVGDSPAMVGGGIGWERVGFGVTFGRADSSSR